MEKRAIHRLTDFKAKSLLPTGRHADGAGLYLAVTMSGTKSWVFMWTRVETRSDGTKRQKRVEMGLGRYPDLTIVKAREAARHCREAVAEGRNPLEERHIAKTKSREPTFSECADQFLSSMEKSWKNVKHRAQWRMTLGPAYCAQILKKRVSAINTDDILKVLDPVWNEKPETASRLRGRIERVLEYAKARGWRTGDNPALWRGHLRGVLPPKKSGQNNHAALPFKQLPEFMPVLKNREGLAARALEFLILTAARTGEVLGATWDEIDFEKAVWSIPAKRMKAGRKHTVPLTKAAMDLLRPLYEARISKFIFPGQKVEKPLSNMAMEMQLRRMNMDDITVHGFRSCFADWATEETTFANLIVEAALAHLVGDETERAYRRGDVLKKRRRLMDAWGSYILKKVK